MSEHVAAGDRSFVDEEYEDAVKHYTKVCINSGRIALAQLQHYRLSIINHFCGRLLRSRLQQMPMNTVRMHTSSSRSTSRPYRMLPKLLSSMARTPRPTCAKGTCTAVLSIATYRCWYAISDMQWFALRTACFYLEEYETALQCFQQGQQLAPGDNKYEKWIHKCKAELDGEYELQHR